MTSKYGSNEKIGKVFGRLLVLSRAESGEWYYCRCLGKEQGSVHCSGDTIKTLGSRLKRGTTKSCGCFAADMRQERWAIKLSQLIGKKFGYLTIQEVIPPQQRTSLGYSSISAKDAVVKCICDCGNQVTAMCKNLRRGHTISCGCVRRTHGTTAASVSFVYTSYKRRAKYQVKKDFNITFEDFAKIVKRPCAYCGAISPERRCHGLDRVNNKEGYVYGNIVSCCCICNLAKNGLSLTEFLDWRNSFAAKELKVEDVLLIAELIAKDKELDINANRNEED